MICSPREVGRGKLVDDVRIAINRFWNRTQEDIRRISEDSRLSQRQKANLIKTAVDAYEDFKERMQVR